MRADSDDVVGVHPRDGVPVVAQGGEDVVGVFAESGDPVISGVKSENLIGLPTVR